MINTPTPALFSRVKRERKSIVRPQRKQLILNFIHEFRRIEKFSPTCEEIAQGIGYTKNTTGEVHRLVNQLIEEGWLKNTPKVARSILPLKKAGAVYCEITEPELQQIADMQKDLRILES